MTPLLKTFHYHSFYKGLTRNPEIGIPPSEFCPVSEDWDNLGIPNLARTFLMK